MQKDPDILDLGRKINKHIESVHNGWIWLLIALTSPFYIFPEVHMIVDPIRHSGPLTEIRIFRGVYRPCEQFCLVVGR